MPSDNGDSSLTGDPCFSPVSIGFGRDRPASVVYIGSRASSWSLVPRRWLGITCARCCTTLQSSAPVAVICCLFASGICNGVLGFRSTATL